MFTSSESGGESKKRSKKERQTLKKCARDQLWRSPRKRETRVQKSLPIQASVKTARLPRSLIALTETYRFRFHFRLLWMGLCMYLWQIYNITAGNIIHKPLKFKLVKVEQQFLCLVYRCIWIRVNLTWSRGAFSWKFRDECLRHCSHFGLNEPVYVNMSDNFA